MGSQDGRPSGHWGSCASSGFPERPEAIWRGSVAGVGGGSRGGVAVGTSENGEKVPAIHSHLLSSRAPFEDETEAQFRLATDDLTPREQGELRAFVREMRNRQAILRDALEEYGTRSRSSGVGSLREGVGRQPITSRIRSILDFTVDEYRAQRSPEAGFRFLRGQAEAAGAYVILSGDLGSHHSALRPEIFRGLVSARSRRPVRGHQLL